MRESQKTRWFVALEQAEVRLDNYITPIEMFISLFGTGLRLATDAYVMR